MFTIHEAERMFMIYKIQAPEFWMKICSFFSIFVEQQLKHDMRISGLLKVPKFNNDVGDDDITYLLISFTVSLGQMIHGQRLVRIPMGQQR
jgi:hypothetical protein